MNKTALGIAGAVALGITAGSAGAAEKVSIGVPSWTGAQAIAHLLAAVVEERESAGAYTDVVDFARRLGNNVANKRQLENLVKAGAFDGLEANRRRLFDGVAVARRRLLAHRIGELRGGIGRTLGQCGLRSWERQQSNDNRQREDHERQSSQSHALHSTHFLSFASVA